MLTVGRFLDWGNSVSPISACRETRSTYMSMYLAHDIRTPLTSVLGYLELLEKEPEMSIEQRSGYVHIALDKANRLEKMINEFFEITRYNSGQVTLSKVPIDLYYMLVQLSDELSPLFSNRGNSVILNIDENITIYADADKIARVFSNILKNAAAYSYPKTEIVISAEVKENQIALFFAIKEKRFLLMTWISCLINFIVRINQEEQTQEVQD